MSRHTLLLYSLCAALAVVATGCAHGAGNLQSKFDAAVASAPPLPHGYATPKDLQKAQKAGEIKTLGPEDLVLPDTIAVVDNIEYGNAGGIPLQLNLFYPKDLTQPVPGLIFIHGGGWELKGKEFYTFWTARYARRGYVCATIEYRVSSEAKFPAAVQDTECAVRWMRANADKYHIDPNRIAVIGQSAGASLALFAGYAPDLPLFQSDCYPGVSSKVQAVVAYYPATDLTANGVEEKGYSKKWIGVPYNERPDLYLAASPIHYLSKDAPPTLLYHGTIDGIVPVEQSDALAAKLKALGVPYIYDREPGWDHAMDIFKGVNKHALGIQDAFLDAVLHFDGKKLND